MNLKISIPTFIYYLVTIATGLNFAVACAALPQEAAKKIQKVFRGYQSRLADTIVKCAEQPSEFEKFVAETGIDDNTCSICFEDVTQETGGVKLSCSCKKLLHADCLREFVSHVVPGRNIPCPNCRSAPVRMIRKLSADPTTCIQRPILNAIKMGRPDVLSKILRMTDPSTLKSILNSAPGEFFSEASSVSGPSSMNKILSLLADAGANPSVRGRQRKSILELGIEQSAYESLRALLKSPNLDLSGPSFENPRHYELALYLAAAEGYREAIDHFLKRGVDPNFLFGGVSPLTIAIQKKQVQSVQALLEGNAKIEKLSSFAEHPMDAAIANYDSEILSLLIKQGADPDTQTGFSNIPLLLSAVEKQDEALVALLLDHGAHPNWMGGLSHMTPLAYAVSRQDLKMVQALLNHPRNSAHPNQTIDARSPLILAAELGNPWIVEALLKAGADPQFDYRSYTALETAEREEHFAVADLLRPVTRTRSEDERINCQLARLHHPDPEMREDAAFALLDMKRKGFQMDPELRCRIASQLVITYLDSLHKEAEEKNKSGREGFVRYASLHALEEIGLPDTHDTVLVVAQAVGDSNPFVRASAAVLLQDQRILPSGVFSIVLKYLNHSNEEIQLSAIDALIKTGSKGRMIFRELSRRLKKDPGNASLNSSLRRVALQSDPEIQPAITALLWKILQTKSNGRSVAGPEQDDILRILVRLNPRDPNVHQAFFNRLPLYGKDVGEAVSLMQNINPKLIASLLPLTYSRNAQTRLNAYRALVFLRKMSPPSVQEALVQALEDRALKDEDQEIQILAQRSIQRRSHVFSENPDLASARQE